MGTTDSTGSGVFWLLGWLFHLCVASAKGPDGSESRQEREFRGSITPCYDIGAWGVSPRKGKEGQGFPAVLGRVFYISQLASVVSSSAQCLSVNVMSLSRGVDCFACMPATSSHHPSPGDMVVMKSPGASFAHHCKAGQCQEPFNRLFISNSKSVSVFQAFRYNSAKLLYLTYRQMEALPLAKTVTPCPLEISTCFFCSSVLVIFLILPPSGQCDCPKYNKQELGGLSTWRLHSPVIHRLPFMFKKLNCFPFIKCS